MSDEQAPQKDLSRMQLRLNRPASARKSLARLMRMRLRGEIPSPLFRDLIYAFSTLSAIWKFEVEASVEARLDALEKAQEEQECRNVNALKAV